LDRIDSIIKLTGDTMMAHGVCDAAAVFLSEPRAQAHPTSDPGHEQYRAGIRRFLSVISTAVSDGKIISRGERAHRRRWEQLKSVTRALFARAKTQDPACGCGRGPRQAWGRLVGQELIRLQALRLSVAVLPYGGIVAASCGKFRHVHRATLHPTRRVTPRALGTTGTGSQRSRIGCGECGAEFATKVALGVQPSGEVRHHTGVKRRQLSLDDYFIGVRAGDMSVLARAITLFESNATAHQESRNAMTRLLPFTGGAMRVGITGIRAQAKDIYRMSRHASVRGRPEGRGVGGRSVEQRARRQRAGRQGAHGKVSRHPARSSARRPGRFAWWCGAQEREAMRYASGGFRPLLIETVGSGRTR
jgi:hypothetical protein